MVDFTAGPAPGGFFSPLRFEADVFDCEVEGQVPQDLNGAFYRVGGEWFYPPSYPDDIPLSTDGYISMFRINNGVVDFRGRWVKTPRFLNNLKARRQLYGKYRNPYTYDPSVQNLDKPYLGTVANTAPLAHNGKLFAMKEDAHPIEIDPMTLETIGAWDFDGQYTAQTFSAHPKIDPVSGDLVCYGYEATGLCTDDVWAYIFSADGQLKNEIRFKVPYVSAIHDIVITQEHIIFPVFGFVTGLDKLQTAELHWNWDPNMPTYYGIVSREGDGSDARWFRGPSSVVMHTINGRSEGSKVIIEVPSSDGNFFPFIPSVDGSLFNPVEARHFIRRLTFDLASSSETFTEEILDPTDIVDLAKVDHRYLTLPYQYVYSTMHDPDQPFDEERGGSGARAVNSFCRYDLGTGEWRKYFVGDTHNLQEVSFIPRNADAPEGDGYLIGTASNYAEMRTELLILDAQEMDELARVSLPFRMTPQVHGAWYDASELPMGDTGYPEYDVREQS